LKRDANSISNNHAVSGKRTAKYAAQSFNCNSITSCRSGQAARQREKISKGSAEFTTDSSTRRNPTRTEFDHYHVAVKWKWEAEKETV
jgi:hypothetical protein